ncbi:DNA repair helicase XPB [Treponema sp.]|uniref:DNA repair helicase XPB n=1 Tax=Treponema sp. TaxID=166 RepID=UPI003F07D6FF
MPGIENPLIVQSDRTLLLDVHSPRAGECRAALIPFAELVSSPEHLHTYQISSLSLWNAESSGFTGSQAIEVLREFSRYEIPDSVAVWIEETSCRFGKLRLVPGPSVKPEGCGEACEEYLYLVSNSESVFRQIEMNAFARKFLVSCECSAEFSQGLSENERQFCFRLLLTDRGIVKQNLLKLGWPVKDDVPLQDGIPLDISIRTETLSGKPFEVRQYQKEAACALVGNRGPGTGFGTIVLPCGAGKTIVGMEIMSLLKTNTLIVTTNITAVHQWINELLDKTFLDASQIAEYTSECKEIKPVTVATYQILTWRPDKNGPYPHFSLFRRNNWGLVIYDEVHMIPAPVFRIAAELQAVRRVGLTATLVREDGCEGHVFSLVGPKRYDVPWKELEKAQWIARAECVEVRLTLSGEKELEYAVAGNREKYRIASENPLKIKVVQELVELFPGEKILIIGQFLSQLEKIAALLCVPIITGKTKNSERDKIYSDFRTGKIRVLVVSKVANFAIDLPDASMAIQISGTFGSRQEEAQRLGRILRPKEKVSRFFTLISRGTIEEDFGSNRQKFLAEQGYSYRIIRYDGKESFAELDEPLGIEGCGL